MSLRDHLRPPLQDTALAAKLAALDVTTLEDGRDQVARLQQVADTVGASRPRVAVAVALAQYPSVRRFVVRGHEGGAS